MIAAPAGVIAPLITSPANVTALVAARRYPPAGIRSFGPIRVGVAHGATDLAAVAAAPLIFPMIETAAALEQFPAIADVAGISGLYVGPADLSLSLGLPLPVDVSSPTLRGTLTEVAATCAARGLIAGIYANAAAAADLAALGYQLITIVSDGDLIRNGGAAALAALRR